MSNENEEVYVVYGKQGCKYCTAAVQVLSGANAVYEYHDVVEEGLVEDLKNDGHKTVPQIWLNNHHIGGYTELVEFLNR